MGAQSSTVLVPGSKVFAIGIDPGFGELGLVMFADPYTIADYTTYKSPANKNHWSVARACSMAEKVIGEIEAWVHRYDPHTLGISIEMPIYNRNPANFAKQWRLVQELESAIMFRTDAWELDKCILIEIEPTASKRIATGNGSASKADIVKACPLWYIKDSMAISTQEALADAWAHSLAVWTPDVGSRIDVSKLVALNIQQIGKCER